MLKPGRYDSFKRRCTKLAKFGSDWIVAEWIIESLLRYWLMRGNTAAADQIIEGRKQTVQEFRERLQLGDDTKEVCESGIKWLDRSPAETRAELRDGYKWYTYLCEQVMAKL